MNAEPLTLEERMAAMEAALAEAKAENEALKARQDDPVAGQDALQQAIDALDRKYRSAVPNAYGTKPCVQLVDGQPCGREWGWHHNIEAAGHSYREKELPSVPSKPGLYAKDSA
ncbi:MAG: hypothetical protein O2888_03390 [Chloroflexi bacterium]|nr:hypothetical protein [Chloroflexota bacterium]